MSLEVDLSPHIPFNADPLLPITLRLRPPDKLQQLPDREGYEEASRPVPDTPSPSPSSHKKTDNGTVKHKMWWSGLQQRVRVPRGRAPTPFT